MTELEQKAEEYISDLVLTKYTESDTIPNIRQRFYSYNDMIKAYKDGYEQGQDEARLQKEIEELKWEQKQILEDNENYQKENEELKATISKMETLAENRGAFIDWCLEKYPEIVKEYNGFEKE